MVIHQIVANDGEKLQFVVTCPKCREPQTLTTSVTGYQRWIAGEFIQHAMPEIAKDERELLISGICQSCWDKLFGEDPKLN